MIYLNYTDLNEDAKERLLESSRVEVQEKFGEDIKRYSDENNTNFEKMIEEEAMRNMYSYNYVFNI